jgi:hypothetical protein
LDSHIIFDATSDTEGGGTVRILHP